MSRFHVGQHALPYSSKRRRKIRQKLIDQHGMICKLCFQSIPERNDPDWEYKMQFSIDHIIPLSRGGSHALENLQPAHHGCNTRRGNKCG